SKEITFAFDNIWKTHAIGDTLYFQSYQTIFKSYKGEITTIHSKNKNPFHLSFQFNDEIYIRERKVGVQKLEGNNLKFIKGSEAFSEYGLFGIVPYDAENKAFISFEIGMWKNDLKNNLPITPICADSCSSFFNKGIIGGLKMLNGNYVLNSINSGLYITDSN